MPKIILSANTDWYLYNFRKALALRLQENDFEVVFVTPSGKYASQFEALGLKWISWKLDRKTISLWKEIQSFFHILQIYRSQRPDIVHHHTIKSVLYGSLAAQLVGVPGIVNSITGLGYVFLESDFQAAFLKKIITPFYKWAHRFQNSVAVFENQPDRDYFIRAGFIPEERSILIESIGADPVQFYPVPEPVQNPFVVLMAGRLLWDKGVGIFVEAARMLKPEINARFILVGEPDLGNPASIDPETLQRWHDEVIIEWWGWQSDMQSVYARSHVVVLPTMYGEGVPTTLIEGAACGRALIGSDTPGCRPVIQPGVNGFLIPQNDSTALAQAIEQLANDPYLRQKMGKNGREIFLEKFTYEKVNHTMMEVFAKLLLNGMSKPHKDES